MCFTIIKMLFIICGLLFLFRIVNCCSYYALVDHMLPTETKIKIHNEHCAQIQNCCGESIKIEHNFKYLEIEISSNMRWKNQINALVK